MPIFLSTPIQDRDCDRRCTCDNCGADWLESELHEIDDLQQRLSPGEIVPAGQCPDPDCGALCYLQDEKTAACSSANARMLSALKSVEPFLCAQEEFGLDVSAELNEVTAAIAAAESRDALPTASRAAQDDLLAICHECLSDLLAGDYDDGDHPVVAGAIEKLSAVVKAAEAQAASTALKPFPETQWKAVPDQYSDGIAIAIEDCQGVIALIPQEDGEIPISATDWRRARLMAAAPQLLAACKAALWCPALNCDELDEYDYAAIDAAHAAILAAEGGAT